MSVSPEDLADVTAEQCFLEADLNNDHKLSLEEFKKWFNKPSNVSSSGMTEKPSWLSLDEARRLAGLSNFSALYCHIIEILKKYQYAKRNLKEKTCRNLSNPLEKLQTCKANPLEI